MNINDKLYDAYYIENKNGIDFTVLNSLHGSIGVTLDNKVNGVAHTGLKLFNAISANFQKIPMKDNAFGIDLEDIMHAFVVLDHIDPTSLKVCEAVGSGFTSAEIKFGDEDWTSMILFVPKNTKVREEIIVNSQRELSTEKDKPAASYAFLAGVMSVFTQDKTTLSSMKNKELIASELVHLLKEKSIKDYSGNPKAAICSQLATRILRSSLLTAEIPADKRVKYKNLSDKALQNKLVRKISKMDSPLFHTFWSSKIFQVEADTETLPYELFRTLIAESDIHKPSS